MEDKNTVGMKEQRLRRQRVGRIKMTIIMTIVIGILLSMICCVGLLVQVVRLGNRIDIMEANSASVEQRMADIEEYQQTIIESIQAGDISEEDALEAMAGQSEDNLVQEGIRQKVYLTFDDGPSENTVEILDILKEKNVKATFFVIGTEDESLKEVYQRIVAEGHTLGMHSYSHKYSVVYNSLESFQDDFNRLRTYLTEITGVEPAIMRFPGGSSNKVSNIDMAEFIGYLNEEGVNYYDWNVSSGDATSQIYTVEELIGNVIEGVERYDTSIVLMHDSSAKGTTVEALGTMIDQLKAMNVELLPITEKTKLIQHVSADSINE